MAPPTYSQGWVGGGGETCISYVCVNVSSLARRIDHVLSWNYDVVILSEVRASRVQKAALSRRAGQLGFHIFFSHAPPASPTFETSPGGVAIAVKHGYTLRKIHPPEFCRWHDLGRAVAGVLLHGDYAVYLGAPYGFPKGHPQQHCNETMLAEIFHWMAGLSTCAIVGGDLNESEGTSTALSLADQWRLSHIASFHPTTRGKTNPIASTPPLDHVVVNAAYARTWGQGMGEV